MIERTFNMSGNIVGVLARAHALLRLPPPQGESEIVQADRVLAELYRVCNGRPHEYLWYFRNAERVECAYPSVKIE